MKKIKLSKNHIDKIIEMCRYYYPTYYSHWAVSMNNNLEEFELFLCFNENNQYTSIGWLEFCLLNLMDKITPSFDSYKEDIIHGLDKQHIVDFIYAIYLEYKR